MLKCVRCQGWAAQTLEQDNKALTKQELTAQGQKEQGSYTEMRLAAVETGDQVQHVSQTTARTNQVFQKISSRLDE